MGRILIRLIAEWYGIDPEIMKGLVHRDELFDNADLIYGSKSQLCNLLRNKDVLRLLKESGWSPEGVLKLVSIGEEERTIFEDYYDSHLDRFPIHNVRKNKIIKQLKDKLK